MEILIRKATLQDAQALAALGASTFFDTYHAFNTTEDMSNYLDKYFTISNLETELQEKNTTFYVAETNEQMIGYIKLMAGGNTYIPEIKAMEIARFYVSNAFKGLKVGKKLMQTAENLAKSMSCKAMWLGVWHKNTVSVEIYKALGYQIVGNTTFILGADIQDDYIMVKHLDT